MSTTTVNYLDGERFAIGIRGHMVTVDQPLADGGEDSAPTPTELSSRASPSCVAFYARRYLARHRLPTTGLSVTADSHDGHTPGAGGRRQGRHSDSRRRPHRASRRPPRRRIALHRAQHADLTARSRHRHPGGRAGCGQVSGHSGREPPTGTPTTAAQPLDAAPLSMSWLRGDVIAGVTVGVPGPQVMAYAGVAGLPPVAGLWAAVPRWRCTRCSARRGSCRWGRSRPRR